MSKRNIAVGLLSVFVIILVALYFLNSKLHFLADIIEGPYVIFQKDNFTQITWDTQPTTNEILRPGDKISTFAAQGQTEDVSFSVKPNVDLGEVQLEVTDLKRGDKVIPRENIEVLNLKVWDQCAPTPTTTNGNWIVNCMNSNPLYVGPAYQTTHKYLPEVLVKNNEQDLIGEDQGWDRDKRIYTAPQVSNNFKAVLGLDSEGKSKTHTFYLRVKVPDDAVAGQYSGNITFRPSNDIGSQLIKLSLEVLQFKLPDSGKEMITHASYAVKENENFYSQFGRPNIGGSDLSEAKARYVKYLQFLRESGFTSLIINDYDNIEWVAQEMKRQHFRKLMWRPIQGYTNQLVNDPHGRYTYADFVRKIDEIKSAGFEDVYIYGVDEPDTAGDMVNDIKYAKLIHQAGAKVAVSISKQVSDANNTASFSSEIFEMAGATPEQAKIDLPIYNNSAQTTSGMDQYLNRDFDPSWRMSVNQKKATYVFFPNAQPVVGSDPAELPSNSWHKVASTWDNSTGTYQIYVDGVLKKTVPNPNLIGAKLIRNTGRTLVGAYVDDPNSADRLGILAFKGKIADIKVYNTVLTAEQITSDSSSPVTEYDFTSGDTSCIKHGGVATADDGPVTGQKSLVFDGVNGSYLDCGTNDNYGITSAMTVSAWINIPSDVKTTENVIIGKSEARSYVNNHLEDYIIGLRNNTVTKNNSKEYFYNQIWPEYGNLADRRGMSGFYLQSSKLDGYAPYGFDTPVDSEGISYYDDFDANEKAEFAVLPSASGDPVITYQFEAFRAGVDDSRYMTLYDDLLKRLQVKDQAKATAIDKEIQEMLDQYPYNMKGDGTSFANTTPYDPKNPTAPPTPQPNSYHQANRKLVADKIVEMQNILNDKPSSIERINVEEGQKIKTNPYMLSVKVKDVSKVSKVEYYIDNILIGTATLPDVNGVYDWPWDTSKYHSIVKIIVYGTDGQTEELIRNTTVDLSGGQEVTNPIVAVLPKTGENNFKITVSNIWNNIKRAFGNE